MLVRLKIAGRLHVTTMTISDDYVLKQETKCTCENIERFQNKQWIERRLRFELRLALPSVETNYGRNPMTIGLVIPRFDPRFVKLRPLKDSSQPAKN